MTVENTADRPNLAHLAGVMGEGQSAYIESMEAAGQEQLVHSDVIPATAAPDYDSNPGVEEDEWPLLEALGIVRGEPVTGDPLFIHATLPEGWTRSPEEFSTYYSYLLDERGVRRAAIFYKAAFYDRRATIRVVNPGAELATAAIYADGPAILPNEWPKLTTDERAEFFTALEDYRESALRNPTIYGDRLPRIDGLTALANGTPA